MQDVLIDSAEDPLNTAGLATAVHERSPHESVQKPSTGGGDGSQNFRMGSDVVQTVYVEPSAKQSFENMQQYYEGMQYVPSILDNYNLPGVKESFAEQDPVAVEVFHQSIDRNNVESARQRFEDQVFDFYSRADVMDKA